MKKNKQQKIQDVSADEKIIPNQETTLDLPQKKAPIYVRTLNVVINPMRRRYEKHYKESKRHLVIDLIFVFLIILLILSNIILFTKTFPVENLEIKINTPQVGGDSDQKEEPEVVEDTQLILTPSVVYYTSEGEQLGIGPWPPVVGEQSFVRVFINLQTTSHNVSNLIFKAKLPAGIKWADKAVVDSGSPMVYDSASNMLSWNLEKMNWNEKAQASFEIEINPTADNLNKKIKLLENLSVTGFDLMTSKSVTGYGSDVYSPEVVE